MNYGIDDIETLSFKEGVRKRIAMYLGSADMNGVYNSIQEIISNSVDEYYMKFGKRITISLGKDNLITIIDEGRGVPFGMKQDGSNVLVDIFSRPHTGGKFNDKVYQSVGGLNGIGAKATCLASSKFEVISFRDGKSAEAIFEKGNLVDYKESSLKDAEMQTTGTHIRFQPDPTVYNLEEISIDFETLCQKCKNLSYLTKGLTFILEDHTGDKVKSVQYCAKDGLLDLLKDKVSNLVHPTPIYFENRVGDIEIEIALQWTKEKEKSFVFTNGLYNPEGGTSLTGLKTSITRNINKLFKKDFSGEMARSGLVYAVSIKTPNPSFANQTKTKINNPELRSIADQAFSSALLAFKGKYPKDIEAIQEYLCREEKAEKAAQKARDAIINHIKEENAARSKKVLMADKLKDAEFLGENATLLIVEGDSAAASIAVGRDPDYYGILPIRGKMINALTHSIDECLENEEIKAIILSMGCGVLDKYNPKRLRYGRVGICVDADDDGCHIACLIMTFFLVFMPDFIFENRLCWLKAPLFREVKGSKSEYFYSDEEFNKTKHTGTVSRYKGLGELSKDDLKASMFNTEKQRLELLMPSPEAIHQLELLMGADVKPRKDFVFTNIDFSKLEV